MNTFALEATARTEMGGTPSRKLRKDGLTPGVLYTPAGPKHFTASEKTLEKLFSTPENYVINLDIEGTKYDAILAHASFHPLHDNLLDVELQLVDPKKPVEMEIPVRLTGTSEGVLAGGKLVQKTRNLRVRGKVADLPAYLDIDISGLRLGRSLIVSELSFPNITLTTAKDVPVASVEITRQLRQEAAAAAKTPGKKK